MEFVASFSGGKDSILSIKRMIDNGNRIVAIIISTIENEGLSWTHKIDLEYFKRVAEILKCEVIFTNTDIKNYEIAFEKALDEAKSLGASVCIFGDIDIPIHLSWNKSRCMNVGIECIHPLMFEDREKIVSEFIHSGIKAKIVKVDENKLPLEFVGMDLSIEMVEKIKTNYPTVDLCGENGEYHTIIDLESLKNNFNKSIYLDNASTSFPKAPGVATEVLNCIDTYSYSINRGTYMAAYELQSKVIDVRDKVKKFFNAGKDYECIFTSSATESVNILLRGLLSNGDILISDNRKHNSANRTIEYIKGIGIDSIEVSCFEETIGILGRIPNNRIKAIFITLVDNVTGELFMELDELVSLSEECKRRGIYLIVDAVQAVCEYEIDIDRIGLDALISTAHIGFMGPEGLGVIIISKHLADKLEPLIYGGTGSKSNESKMPETLPDKFEAGTLNIPGIIGFGKALDYIERVGIDNIINKKKKLGSILRRGLNTIEGARVSGEGSFCLLNIAGKDMAYLSFYLDNLYKIQTRVGIHCSKESHINNNTFPEGGIRLSVGYYNTEEEIYGVIDKIDSTNKEY